MSSICTNTHARSKSWDERAAHVDILPIYDINFYVDFYIVEYKLRS